MKKKIVYAGAALVVMFSACSKDFLKETPTDVISVEDLGKAVADDPALLDGSVAGLYSTMFLVGTGGSPVDDEDHDDFGQKSWDIYMDMLSSDMALVGVNYGWYDGIALYTESNDFTRLVTYMPWRYYYRIVFAANNIIDALENAEFDPADQLSRRIMGQAKAMRAYAYFYLSNLYSREAYGTGEELILPLYEDTTVPNQPLSKASDVYDVIVSDLEAAIEYLDGYAPASKERVTKDVAQGLLAYALATRGTPADLQRVVTLTNDVISSGRYPLTNRNQVVAYLDGNGELTNTDPYVGFNNVATPSWIWGMDLNQAQHGLNLISWWGQVDLFTYSYAWAGDPKVIDATLYAAIPDDDIRKGQFEEGFDLMPTGKFFAPARVIGGQRYIETDYIYMRVEEMYLLNAEAHARLQASGPAINRLKELLSLRVDDTDYLDALQGQALINEIHKQTRIELWGEGKSYLSLKRNKLSVTRGSNHLLHAGQTFQYNAPELTLVIPQAEILNNPFIN